MIPLSFAGSAKQPFLFQNDPDALAKYKVRKDQAGLINHQIAKAYMAHLKGNEIIPKVPIGTKGFSLWLRTANFIK